MIACLKIRKFIFIKFFDFIDIFDIIQLNSSFYECKDSHFFPEITLFLRFGKWKERLYLDEEIAVCPINDSNCESAERKSLSSIRRAMYYEFPRWDEILLFSVRLRPIIYYRFPFSHYACKAESSQTRFQITYDNKGLIKAITLDDA